MNMLWYHKVAWHPTQNQLVSGGVALGSYILHHKALASQYGNRKSIDLRSAYFMRLLKRSPDKRVLTYERY